MLKVFSCFAAKTNWGYIEQLRWGEKYRLHADIWRSLVLHRLKIWNHFSRRYWWSIKKFPKAHRISVGFLRVPSCSTNESNSHIKVNRGERNSVQTLCDERDRNVDDCRKFDDFPKTKFCSLSLITDLIHVYQNFSKMEFNPLTILYREISEKQKNTHMLRGGVMLINKIDK